MDLFPADGFGAMLYSLRDNDDLSLIYDFDPVSEMHFQLSLLNVEQFILLIVLMPDKFTAYLSKQDLHFVNYRYLMRMPMITEFFEFILKIDCFHLYLILKTNYEFPRLSV